MDRITSAWTYVCHGAGRYKNLETGLEREFKYPPTRGKWTLMHLRRIPLHVDGHTIWWHRATAAKEAQ